MAKGLHLTLVSPVGAHSNLESAGNTMKTKPIAWMMAFAIGSPQAVALTAENFTVTTTRDLVRLCEATPSDALYDVAKGFCLGYVDAAMDYHTALTGESKFKPIVCPDGSLTRDQVVAELLRWASSNQQLLDSEDPIHGVMRSASNRWPCAGS